ncbi:OmpA family protein [Acidisphaera sp. L21]|uniref:OmpA family protein n=1 Tax=Acidisphaera sp. L21 TaxID=1641851 RepID=UPI0020B17097|nr:OmpA family protein [Acidisphaera sp. L21]
MATDVGGVGVGSIGWGFGNGLRLEVEGNVRHNRVRQISGFAAGPTASGGDQYSYGGMVNALFDMDIGLNWLYPYFGLGAGVADTYLDRVHSYGVPSGVRVSTNGWSTNFAYQGIFGLSFPLAAVPGLSLTAEYRFYGVLDAPGFHAQDNVAVQAPGGIAHQGRGNFNVSSDYNHSLLLGVRYAFDTAPPAPPLAQVAPTPAVTPARTYLVFFDWDRADLTDRARQIVADAAQASTRVQSTRIEVQGNADRSGTPAYNQGLSLRRAQTVAAELVRDGVPRSAIVIQAFGDTQPLVPTAAGVREPQNRRVAIILR